MGVGKNFRHLAAHEIARALSPNSCVALPMFHAFTGCDLVLEVEARGQHGTPHGRYTTMSPQLQHSVHWFLHQPYKPLRNIWSTWSNLWSCYKTVQVVSLVSTKQESSCSLRKAEQLMDFPLHKLRSSSMSIIRGPLTRLVIAGPR